MDEFLQTIIKDSELVRRLVVGGFWYSGGSLLFVLGILIKFWSSSINTRITKAEDELSKHKDDDSIWKREFESKCRERHEYKGVDRRH